MSDFTSILDHTGLARSSAHAAINHLSELGVIEIMKESPRNTGYRIASRDAIERAANQLAQEFRNALLTTEDPGAKPRLVFTDNYVLPEHYLQELRSRYEITTYASSPNYVTSELLIERSKDADVIVRYDFAPIDRSFLGQMPKLKAVVFPNCLPSNVDWDACRDFGVQTKHADIVTQKYFAETQLEYTVNALLTLLQPLERASHAIANSGDYYWKHHQGQELNGKRIGIFFSDSNITKFVDVFQALGCEVAASSDTPTPPLPGQFGLTSYHSLEDLWEWADVALFLDNSPIQLDPLLTKTKIPQYLIVTTRSVEYDLEPMREQLVKERIKGLAADYLDNELLSRIYSTEDSRKELLPLTDLPNVLITPELSVVSADSLARSYEHTFAMLMELHV